MFAPPPPPVANFTIPAGVQALPTIAAYRNVVAWSSPEDGLWSLHVAGDDAPPARIFDRQRWPVDVSVGAATDGGPVVSFSSCKGSRAATRVRAQGCDLERLSSLSAKGRPVPFTFASGAKPSPGLKGASTKVGSETAPSLSGQWLLFARTNARRLHGSLIARNIRTGVERNLPHGDLGHCSPACVKDGFAAGAPLATSASGTRFGALWESINGPNALGIAGNDQVIRGAVLGTTLGTPAGTSFISGTDSSVTYGSVQQIGTVTQDVRHAYDGDGPAPVPGSQDVVQRVTASGDVSQYVDPAGRRIVAAATGDSGATLWLIHDVQAVPAGTAAGDQPALCSAAVGGCAVDSIPQPTFRAVSRRP